MKTSDAERAVRDARSKLVYMLPYFAKAAYALVLVETNAVPTIAVDQYRRLYFNPRFVSQLKVNDLASAIAHEIGHVLRDHSQRTISRGVSDGLLAKIANVCQDCEINDDLTETIKLSQSFAAPLRMSPLPSWKTADGKTAHPWHPHMIMQEEGQTWEFYFAAVMEAARNPGDNDGQSLPLPSENGSTPDDAKGGGDDGEAGGGDLPNLDIQHDCGSGAHGKKRTWELGAPGRDTEVEGVSDADWRDVQMRVAIDIEEESKRGVGRVAGGWLRWANTMLAVEPIPWYEVLSGHVRNVLSMASGMVLHTWTRPSRRASAVPNIALPYMRRPKPALTIVADTSGSMGERELSVVRGVVQDLCDSLGVTPRFISVDMVVHSTQESVSSGAEVEFQGGGGTDMCVGIEAALEDVRLPDAIIVITDCGTGWPDEPTPVPLIICDVTNAGRPGCPEWAEYVGVVLPEEV